MDGEANSGTDLGEELQANGWRQCRVFRPDNSSVLPDYLKFNPETEWLALSTQSCSICARGPDSEPIVEVIVVTPLETYDPKSGPAKGGVIRRLHLPVVGLPDFKGILLDISRRAFLPKELLAGWTPSPVSLEEKGLIAFKKWMSRYYGRVAIPNELDIRLKSGNKSVVKTISKLLEKKLITKDRTGDSIHYTVSEDVKEFYISWKPLHDELAHNENYIVSLLVVCRQQETRDYLDEQLSVLESGVKGAQIQNKIIMKAPDVKTQDNVTLEDLAEMHLFTHWDELSDATKMLTDRAAL